MQQEIMEDMYITMTTIKKMTIITNEISLTSNNLPDGNFQVKPYITRRFGKVQEKENEYGVEMQVAFKDEPENRFPINLTIRITGLFEIEGDDVEEINNFLKVQGVQMVFPYLRSMVSNITSSALLPSIMLPIINPLDFKDEEKDD